jgi:hypothetical protein
MHPIEEFWQHWRKDDLLRSLIGAGEEITAKYERRTETVHPPQVALGGGPVLEHLIFKLGHRGLNSIGAEGTESMNRLAFAVNMLAGYSETKYIYKPTKELAKELAKFKDPLSWPVESLTIPRRGIGLDFSALLGDHHPDAYITVAYDIMTDADAEGAWASELVLNVGRLRGTHLDRIITLPVDADGLSVWETFRRSMVRGKAGLETQLAEAMAESRAHGQTDLPRPLQGWPLELDRYQRDIDAGPDGTLEKFPILALVLSTLFYLRGDETVVKSIHPGKRPVPPKRINPKKRKKHAKQAESQLAPTVLVVGEKLTQAIQHYEIERERLRAEHGDSPAGTVSPHLRAPHLHPYRCGEGRRDVTLKFHSWISVNGAPIPQALREASFVTKTPVK